jgi:hypothetical protein
LQTELSVFSGRLLEEEMRTLRSCVAENATVDFGGGGGDGKGGLWLK